jgi:dienelactone hydrolase
MALPARKRHPAPVARSHEAASPPVRPAAPGGGVGPVRHELAGLLLLGALCSGALPAAGQEKRTLAVTIDGQPSKLRTVTYKPEGEGPFATLIFHFGSQPPPPHGRTHLRRTYQAKPLVEWFTARGWAVVLPSRRGAAGLDGTYDEDSAPDRPQAQACDPQVAMAEAERALADVEAVTTEILQQPFVDRHRLAVGGQSRGGALAIAWSGRKPAAARAVLNFSGGWFGGNCWSADLVNQALFKLGIAWRRPSLWLYGGRDPYYRLRESRGAFAAFEAAGGDGRFYSYEPPVGMSGHDLQLAPQLWTGDLEAYLAAMGLASGPAS